MLLAAAGGPQTLLSPPKLAPQELLLLASLSDNGIVFVVAEGALTLLGVLFFPCTRSLSVAAWERSMRRSYSRFASCSSSWMAPDANARQESGTSLGFPEGFVGLRVRRRVGLPPLGGEGISIATAPAACPAVVEVGSVAVEVPADALRGAVAAEGACGGESLA